jgi:DNA replication protein DnaC
MVRGISGSHPPDDAAERLASTPPAADRACPPALANEEDRQHDYSLRPRSLAEFVGQERLKKVLAMSIEAARRRGEPLDHVLFSAPPGLGKTSLAHIIARELGVNLRVTSGPAIERAGDLAAIVNDLTATALITTLGKALAEGKLDEWLKLLTQPQLLICDEIGYLPINRQGPSDTAW